jgi:2-succinyl-5-enolpyruvyl-6-hydroxy-3-cyclohexene-1-carboxylate synthase
MTNRDLVVVLEFVRTLREAGVVDVVISPGSRSTPLTMAFARHGGYCVWSVLDERSAAFFALGLARSTGRPVALVCTSGTAAANYLPAVVEAFHTGVPLLLLTADRPPELRGVGANQTVDQVKLYGTYVKWYAEMPVPQDIDLLCVHARAAACRAIAIAAEAPAGPVHLNWPLREPLIPPEDLPALPHAPQSVRVYTANRAPHPEAVAWLRESLAQARRPLIIAGPQDDLVFAARLGTWSAEHGIPLLADPLSQVRTAGVPRCTVIDAYDAFLRHPAGKPSDVPDLVLRFGRPPVSKVLGQYLADIQAEQVLVTPGLAWQDPFFTVSTVIESDPGVVLESITNSRSLPGVEGERSEWLRAWTARNSAARSALQEAARAEGDGAVRLEGRVFLELADLLPDGALLFAGNSMPVRDLDTFFPAVDKRIRVLANRGASGIDGVVSSAMGAAAGWQGPAWLVIGDVSFYHDFNALALARRLGVDLRVVLIHNDGGGIFRFLPQAGYPDTFEQFQTPHGIDFEQGVEMMGGTFRRCESWAAFRAGVRAAAAEPGLVVLELRTDAEENVRRHRLVMDAVRETVSL